MSGPDAHGAGAGAEAGAGPGSEVSAARAVAGVPPSAGERRPGQAAAVGAHADDPPVAVGQSHDRDRLAGLDQAGHEQRTHRV
jgi:hypothetical protein